MRSRGYVFSSFKRVHAKSDTIARNSCQASHSLLAAFAAAAGCAAADGCCCCAGPLALSIGLPQLGSRWRLGPIDDLIGEALDLDIKFTEPALAAAAAAALAEPALAEPALAAAAAAATFRRLWQRLSADSFWPRAS